MSATDVKDVAQRAIDDPAYAWELLQGDEHPEVRDALLADMDGSDDVSGYLGRRAMMADEQEADDVSGYLRRRSMMVDQQEAQADDVSGYLNPQPLPPRLRLPREVWQAEIAPRWSTIDFATTRGIIVVGG